MDKIIFLDIDGVLNTGSFVESFYAIHKLKGINLSDTQDLFRKDMIDDYGIQFCPVATKMLRWIVEVTGAKIVISSTWRMSGLSVMKDLWRDRGLPGEVIDITPISKDRNRGWEINKWILDNASNIKSYVILDDDDDMLVSQLPRFVQINETYGITYNDAINAIQILGNN